MLLVYTNAFAVTQPKQITITYPTPTSTIIIDDTEGGGEDFSICSTGCDYTTIDAFETAQVSQAGTLIRVHTGTYVWNDTHVGGTAGNEIVWRAYGDGVVTIDMTMEWRTNNDYLIFDGLTWDGFDLPTSEYVYIDQPATHNTFINCIFTRMGGEYGDAVYSSNMMVIQGDYTKVYNSLFTNSNTLGIYVRDGDYNEIRNNRFINLRSAGVQVNPHEVGEYVDELHVSSNIFDNVGDIEEKFAIIAYSQYSEDKLGDAYFYNNLIWDSFGGFRKTIQDSGPSTNIRFFNNTIYNCLTGMLTEAGGAVVEMRNNIVAGCTTATNINAGHTVSNTETSTGYFVTTDDTLDSFLMLSQVLPGYDTNPPVTVDYSGIIRNTVAPDIGAFEYSPYFAFAPPILTITKPIGGSILHVGAGRTYSTVDSAESAASCGDIILVHSGSYSNFIITMSCSSGNELVIQPAGDGDAIFYPTIGDECRVDGSFVIIDGGVNREIIFDGSGITENNYILRVGGDNVTVYQCEFREGGEDNPGNGQFHIGTGGDYNKIYNNYIHDGFSGGVYIFDGDNTEVRNNLIANHDGSGVQWNPHEASAHSSEVIISGNAIWGNGVLYTKPGVALLSSANNVGYNCYVYNNLIWENQTGIRRTEYASQTNLHAYIYNNSIYHNNTYNFLIEAGGNATIRNNNSSGGGVADSYAGLYTISNVETNPTYISTDSTSSDFLKLSAANPGYDTSPPVNIDYVGFIRNSSTPDIGAIEYDGSPQAYSPPNISINNITSPTLQSTLTISGTFNVDSNLSVSHIIIAGVQATVNGSTWSASIPITLGVHLYVVNIIDSNGGTSSDEVTINRILVAPGILSNVGSYSTGYHR